MASEKIKVEDLGLQLAGVDSPFSLIGAENNLGPDDWAWQFLRLNSGYQKNYKSVLDRHDPDDPRPKGSMSMHKNHPERIIRLNERLCRTRFGLSTWLNPRLTRLPKLDRGDSWFFPLMGCSESPEDTDQQIAVESVFSFSYCPTPFLGKSDRSLAMKNKGVMKCFSSPDVWFAIDCSVPPVAQMKSVEVISRMHRDWLHQLSAEIRPGRHANRFSLLADCPWFDIESFDSAFAGADNVHPATLWCAVHIDVLGPLMEQIKEQLKKLNQAYLAHCASGAAQPPIRERFRHELTGPRDFDGSTLTDGHFLKALVICAQLAQHGLDEYEIVNFINQHANPSTKGKLQSNSVRDEWVTGLVKRVERYREQARAFVKGGYRWLIHAQKP